MLGLVDYGSDEEDETAEPMKENGAFHIKERNAPQISVSFSRDVKENTPEGPVLGPALDATINTPGTGEELLSAPGSPYTQSRQIIHSLTLPPIPNVSIPASPPGSPGASASAKVDRFLELKSQGIHFNAKLASSSALKNPSLLQNLMNFAGINEDDQYACTLPAGLKPVPVEGFPKRAYVEELAKSQQDLLKKKETEKLGERREFVAPSGPSSGAGTPQSDGRPAGRGSAAERVMAGLDRERARSPQVAMGTGRKDTEQRRSRFDDRNGRRRSRSRSPKRRRDR